MSLADQRLPVARGAAKAAGAARVAKAELIGNKTSPCASWLDPAAHGGTGRDRTGRRRPCAPTTTCRYRLRADYTVIDLGATTDVGRRRGLPKPGGAQQGDTLVRLRDVARAELVPRITTPPPGTRAILAIFVGVEQAPGPTR